jgi:hypothetical protein
MDRGGMDMLSCYIGAVGLLIGAVGVGDELGISALGLRSHSFLGPTPLEEMLSAVCLVCFLSTSS